MQSESSVCGGPTDIGENSEEGGENSEEEKAIFMKGDCESRWLSDGPAR